MEYSGMQEIAGVSLGKVREGLKTLLDGEGLSVIAEPMNQNCRLAVCIPVYDETVDILLRPLLSLEAQTEVELEEFEAVLVVNNSRSEAENRAPTFLANQKVLEYLKTFKRVSKIKIHIIDKSSLGLAEAENHVAHARNRGCLEIANRFLSARAGAEGVIAMTDGDCRVSPNYVREILQTYGAYPGLNGLTGVREHEVDRALPYPDMVQKAFALHTGRPIRSSYALKMNEPIVFQRRHKFSRPLLSCGQDITVPVRAWLACGGIPNLPSGEDYQFGLRVMDLPGEVAATAGYTVWGQIRASDRTGMGGYGRRVKKIAASVCDFMEGRSPDIYVPDNSRQKQFLSGMLKCARDGGLDGKKIRELMLQNGCKAFNPETINFSGLAEMILNVMSRPYFERDYFMLDNYLLEHLYAYFPERKVTRLMKN